MPPPSGPTSRLPRYEPAPCAPRVVPARGTKLIRPASQRPALSARAGRVPPAPARPPTAPRSPTSPAAATLRTRPAPDIRGFLLARSAPALPIRAPPLRPLPAGPRRVRRPQVGAHHRLPDDVGRRVGCRRRLVVVGRDRDRRPVGGVEPHLALEAAVRAAVADPAVPVVALAVEAEPAAVLVEGGHGPKRRRVADAAAEERVSEP